MPKEVERRQMLLDELSTKEKQLEQAFKNESDTFSGRYLSTMNSSYFNMTTFIVSTIISCLYLPLQKCSFR